MATQEEPSNLKSVTVATTVLLAVSITETVLDPPLPGTGAPVGHGEIVAINPWILLITSR